MLTNYSIASVCAMVRTLGLMLLEIMSLSWLSPVDSKDHSLTNFLSGYFETRGQKYLIEPLGTSDRDEHAVYKYEKLEQKSIKTCGVINNTWESDSSDPINDIFKSSNSPEVSTYLNNSPVSTRQKRNWGCRRTPWVAQVPLCPVAPPEKKQSQRVKHNQILKTCAKSHRSEISVTTWVKLSCMY